MSQRKNTALGSNWKDVEKELFTEEEILESELRVSIMNAIIEARQDKGITQKELEKLSGVKQPHIARIENGNTNPQIDTVLKILAPLGKTLKVSPIESEVLKDSTDTDQSSKSGKSQLAPSC